MKAGDADGDEALPGVPRAGGSKYPIDLLKDAGVDMTTDEPLDLTMKADEPRHGRDGTDSRAAEDGTSELEREIRASACRVLPADVSHQLDVLLRRVVGRDRGWAADDGSQQESFTSSAYSLRRSSRSR